MVSSAASMRSAGSLVGRRGGFSRLFCGREATSSRIMRQHSASSAAMKWPTPETELCVMDPPRVSLVTSSWVTVLMTSGLRFYGVLQRIAVCYLVVSLFYLWDKRAWTKAIALVVALVGY